ncbi:hypothetical protein B0T14DRAFT_522104 [Immersiella caudata]|uniref:Uncharacterized protein n=1 Tax=Immersiella caudata TaxID=314043 RepID=A0AA40C0F4_9PEZI|nr:hypothetical protein B0T14DRAFT_522104 [Immersiella caudata]
MEACWMVSRTFCFLLHGSQFQRVLATCWGTCWGLWFLFRPSFLPRRRTALRKCRPILRLVLACLVEAMSRLV